MNSYQWSLNSLYTSYDDPKFIADVNSLSNLTKELQEVATSLPTLDEEHTLLQSIHILEKEYELSYRTRLYTILSQAVNLGDTETLSYLNKIKTTISTFALSKAKIKKYIANINDLDLYLHKNKTLNKYSFFLKEIQYKEKYALSVEGEELLSKINRTSIQAFSDMYYYLTANVTTTCCNQEMTLTQVKNLCHDSSQSVRKEAFICEMDAYKQIEKPLAFAINNIKRQQLMEAQLRGYTSPLDKMLKDSRMQKTTLDAMYKAVDKYLPTFQKYLRTKAKLLGYSNGLPWYEIYATIGKSDMTFSIEDCESFILKHFKDFSDDLYNMTKKAMDEKWIDYPSHTGKQSGAFCENLAWIKESRIITNYSSTLSDVITVAHELGHAYHGKMIEDLEPLNRDYCMPLAETASTFNENIMYNALIKEANTANKLFLIDTQLSALCQNICDIYTRYTFETSVFEQCENNFLFADKLKDLMIKAEKKCFGTGLDTDWLHPYRWITKVHYYIPDIAYYNFPYTFGALFSRGLYAQYMEEGSAFLPKYQALLKASTTHSVEDTALIAGINLSTPEFWEKSLHSIANQMEMFLELAEEI